MFLCRLERRNVAELGVACIRCTAFLRKLLLVILDELFIIIYFLSVTNVRNKSRSSGLRTLLRKLDETRDSRKFCYRLDFAWFYKQWK